MAAAESKTALTLDEERRLIKRLKRGDREAFSVLYEAFAADLYNRVIFPKIPLRDVAEDILRETFLTALEQIGRFHWQGRSIRHWLSRIASNKVIDYHRANQRATRFVQSYERAEEQKPTPVSNPERDMADAQWHVQLKGKMTQLLDDLNPRYRRAVELRFFEDRSRQECADELDVSVNTFDVVLFRAIKRLRQLYERLYGSPRDD